MSNTTIVTDFVSRCDGCDQPVADGFCARCEQAKAIQAIRTGVAPANLRAPMVKVPNPRRRGAFVRTAA